MTTRHSVDFFEAQFRSQAQAGQFALNPFETLALPFIRGRVLDLGCGLGNLSVEAARRGCQVVALDGSPTAIAHVRDRAAAERLPVESRQQDLRHLSDCRDFRHHRRHRSPDVSSKDPGTRAARGHQGARPARRQHRRQRPGRGHDLPGHVRTRPLLPVRGARTRGTLCRMEAAGVVRAPLRRAGLDGQGLRHGGGNRNPDA